jgi:hypothetical protein
MGAEARGRWAAAVRERSAHPAGPVTPKPPRYHSGGPASPAIVRPWTFSDYRRLSIEDGPIIIAFLEPEPFAHFFRHWVQTSEGRRGRVCIGDDCPLCNIGDSPKPVMLFNVVDMDDQQVNVWELGKDAAKKVEKRYDALEAKDKHLNDPGTYFAVARTKKSNGFYEYSVDPVKERDLEEDWNLQPLSDDDIEDLLGNLYGDEIVKVSTISELREFADNLKD